MVKLQIWIFVMAFLQRSMVQKGITNKLDNQWRNGTDQER